MAEVEETRRREEGEHPELDRAVDEHRGGQVPEDQGDAHDRYEGPDPEQDESGDGSDEDQGI